MWVGNQDLVVFLSLCLCSDCLFSFLFCLRHLPLHSWCRGRRLSPWTMQHESVPYASHKILACLSPPRFRWCNGYPRFPRSNHGCIPRGHHHLLTQGLSCVSKDLPRCLIPCPYSCFAAGKLDFITGSLGAWQESTAHAATWELLLGPVTLASPPTVTGMLISAKVLPVSSYLRVL
jgi:hypothetical protein